MAWRGVARHSVLKNKRKPLCAFAALARLPAGTPAGVSSRMNDYRLQYLYRTVLYCLVPAGCRIVAKLTPLRSTSTSSSPPHPDRYFYGRRYYCITFMLCVTGRASHSSLCPSGCRPSDDRLHHYAAFYLSHLYSLSFFNTAMGRGL